MWELKNLSNKDYVEAFKDGAIFAIAVSLSIGLVLLVTVLIARSPLWSVI